MHRLTERDPDGAVMPVSTGYGWIPKLVKRLAQYEDLHYDADGNEIISIEEIDKILQEEGIK